MDFYKQLSGSYDLMTRFDDRIKNEEKILQLWQQKLQFKSAIDIACGTGLHAILLAKMGIKTTGVDLSKEMLQKADENAKRLSVSLPLFQSSMQDLSQNVQAGFDVLFCLGNSIPHILTSVELEQAFKNFFDILNPSGYVVVQLLNYERILNQKHRIVGVHRKGNFEFIRFYDFLENKIQFNILTIEEKEEKLSHSFQSTLLYPYIKKELENALSQFGFSEIQFFGDMKFSKFDKESSSNLVVLARKV
jgi:glycine/sarcosine N-methyltransferase